MCFSDAFDVSAIDMRILGVFNPEMGTDNKLFIDPKLLNGAGQEFAESDVELIEHFRKVVVLIRASHQRGDPAWISARNRMIFKETSNTSLGCSKTGTSGNGIGHVLAGQIVDQAIRILPEVDYDPELLELIGVFGKRIACDRLSDMFVHILKARFLAYTARVAETLGVVKLGQFEYAGQSYSLPLEHEGAKPIILVPRLMLKRLPIALDLEQALDNADFAQSVRESVNALFASAAKARKRLSKSDIRAFINSRPKLYQAILNGYRRATSLPHDFDSDFGEDADFPAIAREIVGNENLPILQFTPQTRVALAVEETIRHLRISIEQQKLSDVLFHSDGLPRNEVIAQRLILSVG